jgi:hypothetical protein
VLGIHTPCASAPSREAGQADDKLDILEESLRLRWIKQGGT